MEPITRKEQYLANISGQDVKIPEPITREEMYLERIATKGVGNTNAVLYTEQELTQEQKEQVRKNIGIIGFSKGFNSILDLLKHAVYDTDMSDSLEKLEEDIQSMPDIDPNPNPDPEPD